MVLFFIWFVHMLLHTQVGNFYLLMIFVRLAGPFLEEFISLWDQVQSISPTLPEQARHLIHRVDDKDAEIRSKASDTDRKSVV